MYVCVYACIYMYIEEEDVGLEFEERWVGTVTECKKTAVYIYLRIYIYIHMHMYIRICMMYIRIFM